ncbi:MAG: IS110 family transposase [Balneolaceae bacterium]|nr:IS110 family transposase [Balneolaceae bacterium]MDZ7720339.1 IS110 family transposase [Balneolaceae bacterium]MDZ7720583.1 IS110 family transposase [Balneolaceae bacterium]
MIYSLGTDMSKDEFSACLQRYNLYEQTYHLLARKTFANKLSGFKACMRWLRRHTNKQPAPVRVTMEATGVYYEPLALHIGQHHPEIHLAVVLPSQSKKFIESQGYRSKTDKIDAEGLSLMGAERKLSAWKGIDPFWRELRSMTRTRSELLEQRTQLRNQLHALSHSGQPARYVDGALQECIQTLSEQIDKLTRLIKKHLKSRNDLKTSVACLKSIPGIGMLTIACILAETNGFAEFHSISQLISFSGYDVVVKQSGKWTGQPKISKKGSKYIRKTMYMPASTIVRCERGPVYELYQRLLSVHNVKMKAHVAVQKKLLTYMYVLWNKQQTFDPDVIQNQRNQHQTKIAPPSADGEATVDTSHAKAS